MAIYPFRMTGWTYDDKVSLISSRRENFGIIIQSEEFSDLMNTLFTVLWQASEPAPDRVLTKRAGQRPAAPLPPRCGSIR